MPAKTGKKNKHIFPPPSGACRLLCMLSRQVFDVSQQRLDNGCVHIGILYYRLQQPPTAELPLQVSYCSLAYVLGALDVRQKPSATLSPFIVSFAWATHSSWLQRHIHPELVLTFCLGFRLTTRGRRISRCHRCLRLVHGGLKNLFLLHNCLYCF